MNEEINQKGSKNCIIQIVPCKTALIQLEKDLYTHSIVLEDMKYIAMVFYASSDI